MSAKIHPGFLTDLGIAWPILQALDLSEAFCCLPTNSDLAGAGARFSSALESLRRLSSGVCHSLLFHPFLIPETPVPVDLRIPRSANPTWTAFSAEYPKAIMSILAKSHRPSLHP